MFLDPTGPSARTLKPETRSARLCFAQRVEFPLVGFFCISTTLLLPLKLIYSLRAVPVKINHVAVPCILLINSVKAFILYIYSASKGYQMHQRASDLFKQILFIAQQSLKCDHTRVGFMLKCECIRHGAT